MRRLGTILACVVFSLALTPRSADAYFWAWLDDWSGPRFMGTEVEWRVWCQSEHPWQNRALLIGIGRRIAVERAHYAEVAATVDRTHPSAAEFDRTLAYADAAGRFLEAALRPSATATDEQKDFVALRAVAWRSIAAAQFTWAKALSEGKPADPMKKPDQPDIPGGQAFTADAPPARDGLAQAEQRAMMAGGLMAGGIVVSACNSAALQRERQYVSLKFGWAFDAKDRNEVYDHRMVTIGASYNVVATPFLTIGSGAGLAVLTSKVRDPFYKFYVNPAIVDFRPGALGRNGRSRGPWYHVFFIRYSTMVVPTGFDPGSFGGQTERYSAELTNNVGLHADLGPVIRKLQGRW